MSDLYALLNVAKLFSPSHPLRSARLSSPVHFISLQHHFFFHFLFVRITRTYFAVLAILHTFLWHFCFTAVCSRFHWFAYSRAISLGFPAILVPICHNDSSLHLTFGLFFSNSRSNTRNWIAVGRHVRHKQHNPTLNLINGQATYCCRYWHDDDDDHHHQLCCLTNSKKD